MTSGKTSVSIRLAAELGVRFIDGDLHPAANVEKMASGTPLTERICGNCTSRAQLAGPLSSCSRRAAFSGAQS